MSDATMHPAGSGRGMLLLIVSLLLLPFGIGGALYVGGWQPPRTVIHGRLLNPPPALPDEVLRATAEARGKWLLIVNIRGACLAECASRVDEMRRIQVALYKNMGRLRRVVLAERPDDPALLALLRAQPDLLLVAARPDALNGSADPLLLADPQGRLIISYPPDTTAQGVRADLERLLKFTSNG